MSLLLVLAFGFGLLLIGYVVGSWLERRHFQSIREREQAFRAQPLLSGREFPRDRRIASAQLITGSVVVSIDHFKRLLAALRMTFGGELGAYSSLLDRARREAILRMRAQCPDADLIINLRIETSSISKGADNAIGSTEILASATALRFAPGP